jgi:acyl carrier protein
VLATLATEHLEARTADESTLVDIWKAVLKLERIGVQDDFFELGGHSLLALQVIARIQTQFARSLELKAFFKHPTIEQCVALLPQLPHCDDADARQPNFDVSAETLAAYSGMPTGNQISMLALPSHAPAYVDNICLALEFAGPFDRDALHTAFAVVTDRHESLRTSFKANLLGKLRAVVAPSVDAFQRFADLSALPEAEAKTQLIEQIKADNKVPFDIARGPLVRFALYKLSESRHVCAIFIHHAITDGWSLNVLLSDLGEAYTASVERRSATFAPLESQYSDFAAWQNAGLDSGALDAQRRFWEQELHALPPALHIGRAERPEHFTFDGQKVGFDLQHETVAIDAYCKEHGMSSYAFLLSAYFLTLFKHTAERDLYILCPVANRKSSRLEHAIGYFANAVIARQSFDPSATLAGFAQRVADKSLEALSNQDFPLATLEDQLCTKHGSEYGARFQLRFNHQNFPGQAPVFGPLTATPVAVPVKGIRTDLILKTWREGASFKGSFVYYDKIFARADIEQLVSEYRSTIALAIASPTLHCGELVQ